MRSMMIFHTEADEMICIYAIPWILMALLGMIIFAASVRAAWREWKMK